MVRESSGTIGRLSEAFDAAWLSGQRPSIDDFLSQADSHCRQDLLRVLVACELKHRSNEASAPTWAEYQQRFPDLLEKDEESAFETLDGISGIADGTNGSGYGATKGRTALPGDGSTAGMPSGSDKPHADDSGSIRLPQNSLTPVKIGRYTIIGKIGKGGQGAVYRGAHPTLPVEVAIKVARHQFDSQAQSSLRSEATVLCDLDHPNIARVRDLDFDQGRPFVVLDYIRGRSMRERLDSQSVSSNESMRWLIQVAEAIDYAHRRGVTHLDLKPDNIVVDETGCPRVIDFGLARLSQPVLADESESGRGVSGTLTYMAPEQARAEQHLIGPASDVFALGAILYRIAVGTGPYGRGDIRTSFDRIQSGKIDFGPLDASPVSEGVRSVAKRALAPEPAGRFATANDFAEALRDAAGIDRAVTASSHSSPSENQSNGKRSVALSLKFLGITISLAVTAAVLLVGGPAWMATGPMEVASVDSSTDSLPMPISDADSNRRPAEDAIAEPRDPALSITDRSRPTFKSIDWMSADRAVVRLRGGRLPDGMMTRGGVQTNETPKPEGVPLQLSVYFDDPLFPMAWLADETGVVPLPGLNTQVETESVIYPPLDAIGDSQPLTLQGPMLLILIANDKPCEDREWVKQTLSRSLEQWTSDGAVWSELRGDWRYNSADGSEASNWSEMEGPSLPLTELESGELLEHLEELRGVLDQIQQQVGGDLSALLMTP